MTTEARELAQQWKDRADDAGHLARAVLRYIATPAVDASIAELAEGDGIYYVAQERGFAPGICADWPSVIPHPTNKNGRLVIRRWPK